MRRRSILEILIVLIILNDIVSGVHINHEHSNKRRETLKVPKLSSNHKHASKEIHSPVQQKYSKSFKHSIVYTEHEDIQSKPIYAEPVLKSNHVPEPLGTSMPAHPGRIRSGGKFHKVSRSSPENKYHSKEPNSKQNETFSKRNDPTQNLGSGNHYNPQYAYNSKFVENEQTHQTSADEFHVLGFHELHTLVRSEAEAPLQHATVFTSHRTNNSHFSHGEISRVAVMHEDSKRRPKRDVPRVQVSVSEAGVFKHYILDARSERRSSKRKPLLEKTPMIDRKKEQNDDDFAAVTVPSVLKADDISTASYEDEFRGGKLYGYIDYIINDMLKNSSIKEYLRGVGLKSKFYQPIFVYRNRYLAIAFSVGGIPSYDHCHYEYHRTLSSVGVACGKHFMFAGDFYHLIADRFHCSWHFRQMAPNFIIRLDAQFADKVVLKIEKVEPQNAFAIHPYQTRQSRIFYDYHLYFPELGPNSAINITLCVPLNNIDPRSGELTAVSEYDSFDYDCCGSLTHSYCGIPTGSYYKQPGSNIAPERFPWQALLYVRWASGGDVSVCSGELISDSWVLVKASCSAFRRTSSMPVIDVVFGETSLGRPGVERHRASELIFHPTMSDTHNIALVKLIFTTSNYPICLPKYRDDDNINQHILGRFGTTLGWTRTTGNVSGKLLKEDHVVHHSNFCSHVKGGKLLPPHMLCTITHEINRKNCLLDVQLTQYAGRYFLYGLADSLSKCGDRMIHTFTSVAYFMPWICNVTGIRMPLS